MGVKVDTNAAKYLTQQLLTSSHNRATPTTSYNHHTTTTRQKRTWSPSGLLLRLLYPQPLRSMSTGYAISHFAAGARIASRDALLVSAGTSAPLAGNVAVI